jgi:hypothetical protein
LALFSELLIVLFRRQQRLDTARSLVREDHGPTFSLLNDAFDSVEAECKKECCQKLQQDHEQLKLDLQAAMVINQELRADLEHAVSLVASQCPTPEEDRPDSRGSPSAVLLELLSSAVNTWKDKIGEQEARKTRSHTKMKDAVKKLKVSGCLVDRSHFCKLTAQLPFMQCDIGSISLKSAATSRKIEVITSTGYAKIHSASKPPASPQLPTRSPRTPALESTTPTTEQRYMYASSVESGSSSTKRGIAIPSPKMFDPIDADYNPGLSSRSLKKK